MGSSPLRVLLALIGLAAVGVSIWVAFQSPYSLWPWALLLVGVGCAAAARRVN